MREVGVPAAFPEQVAREAEAARAAADGRERVEIPFVTVDPPGSKDLDQALHIARRGDGFRVSYAIADVAALVPAGGPLDVEAHARGVTVYAPDAKAPLYPPALSEGSGSLLAGQWRPAVLWTIDLDAAGEQTAVDVRRAEVMSTAQHTYTDLPPEVATPLAEVGELRAALERERGGVSLRLPEQEVVPDDGGGWTTRYRAPVPSEDHNAQISLLTGMAAARLMLDSGVGILRTQQAPDEKSFDRFRLQARALGSEWPRQQAYRRLHPLPRPERAAPGGAPAGGRRDRPRGPIRGVRRSAPAALADRFHFSIAADYAHATAPLRRLQDRYVSECCIAAAAGAAPPDWVTHGLAELPELMQQGDRRAGAVERGVIDLVEALILSGREGERFAALVVDDDTVQLVDPAVRARVEGGCPEPGTRVRARLLAADAAKRTVSFAVEQDEA